MRKLRQLTPKEVFFVGGETHNMYQHTSGLVLLDTRDANISFASFRQHLIDRLGNIPQFRWRLHEVPFGLDLPYWVEDENFSYDHHIKRIAVPSPGDKEALAELVSYLYAHHMDRDHPLWEAWFIEGLAEGRVALFQKIHHCMMDGEAATNLGAAICDFEPDAKPRKVDPALSGMEPGEVPELWRQSLIATGRLYSLPWKASKQVYGALRSAVKRDIRRRFRGEPKVHVTSSSINSDIGRERGFVFGSLSLADIKAVKNQFDVTINDVMLAVVGGSLRNYLKQESDLPQESLRTSMAVSLRGENDDKFSNRVTDVSVTLGTNIADPLQRLEIVASDSDKAKQQAHSNNVGLMEMLGVLPPLGVNMLLQMAPAEQVPLIYGTNLLVSNVRGSAAPMYVSGARIEGTFPMSIIAPGGGINVTCISYVDEVNIGVTFAPDWFPNPWLFIDGLQVALDDYLALVKKARKSTSPAKTRSKTPKPAKSAKKPPARKPPTRKSAKQATGQAQTSAPAVAETSSQLMQDLTTETKH